MASSSSRCRVCSIECTPLQCTRCKTVIYCSRKCQKRDWKKSHKVECNNIVIKNATMDLSSILSNMSIEEAHKQYGMATEKVNQLFKQQQQQEEEEEEEEKNVSKHNSDKNLPPTVTKKTLQPLNSQSTHLKKEPSNKNLVHREKQSASIIMMKDYMYVVEVLPNIQCYHVLLLQHDSSSLVVTTLNQLKLFIDYGYENKSSSTTTIKLVLLSKANDGDIQSNYLMQLTLPSIIPKSDVQISIDKNNSNTICLRLPYGNSNTMSLNSIYNDYDDDDDLPISIQKTNKTKLIDINYIRCKYCHQYLLIPNLPPKRIPEDHPNNNKKIDKLFPLPTGYWDDIIDYLTCYDGQQPINFSSHATSATPHHAYENDTVIVCHKDDLDSSICILAVEGYGESIIHTNNNMLQEEKEDSSTKIESSKSRGNNNKTWKDVVGGATVCCSHCCSTLGFASLDSPTTIRLLKHRLSTGYKQQQQQQETPSNNMLISKCAFSDNTCAAFIAKEMIRYAETQAIYTFVITNRERQQQRPNKCILLRVIRWDAIFAIPNNNKSSYNHTTKLSFRKALKVIFEEQDDHLNDDDDDTTNWFWGGVDLCCPPSNKITKDVSSDEWKKKRQPNTSSSLSIRIFLSSDELQDIRNELIMHSRCTNPSVAKATVLMKLGESNPNANLSFLRYI